jgi:hypothetical protein
VDTYTPRPGDLFLTHIGGATGGAFTLGQFLALAPSVYTHAGIILPGDRVIAAQPGGARIDSLESIINDRPLAILPVPEWAEDRRDLICNAAIAHTGTPYGFSVYPFIGLTRLADVLGARRLVPRWLRDRVASRRSMICSAWADRMWEIAGIHLFNDGRLRGAVMPGQLANVGTVHHIGTGPYAKVGGAAHG